MVVCADPAHPDPLQLPEVGGVADSLTQYPVTPTASVAVNEDTETVKLVAVAGIVKAVTVGAVISDPQ